jgi:hypothetical protein
VSPQWRAELRIGLSPRRVVALRYARGLRRRIEDRRAIDIPPDADSRFPASAVAALKTLLSEPASRAARTTLVLSDSLVRFLVLPWNPSLATRKDREAYARHMLAATYGNAAVHCELRLSHTARGEPWIACAIDTEFLSAVERAEADSGAQIVSMQPYLMSAFNRCRTMLGQESTWFAVVESERTSLGFISGGAWKLLRQRRGASTPLAELVKREVALGDVDPNCDRIALVTDRPERVEAGRMQVRDLTFRAGPDLGLRPYAMALA